MISLRVFNDVKIISFGYEVWFREICLATLSTSRNNGVASKTSEPGMSARYVEENNYRDSIRMTT